MYIFIVALAVNGIVSRERIPEDASFQIAAATKWRTKQHSTVTTPFSKYLREASYLEIEHEFRRRKMVTGCTTDHGVEEAHLPRAHFFGGVRGKRIYFNYFPAGHWLRVK